MSEQLRRDSAVDEAEGAAVDFLGCDDTGVPWHGYVCRGDELLALSHGKVIMKEDDSETVLDMVLHKDLADGTEGLDMVRDGSSRSLASQRRGSEL